MKNAILGASLWLNALIVSAGACYYIFFRDDTVWVTNFSDTAFKNIDCSMSQDRVVNLLGEPLQKAVRRKTGEIALRIKLGDENYSDFGRLSSLAGEDGELIFSFTKPQGPTSNYETRHVLFYADGRVKRTVSGSYTD